MNLWILNSTILFTVMFCISNGEDDPQNETKQQNEEVHMPEVFEPVSVFSNSPVELETEFKYIDGTESQKEEIPLILWWTDSLFPHFSSDSETPAVINCNGDKCHASTDRSLLKDSMTRGILFYGTELDPFDLPIPRQPWHEWALLHEESPLNNFLLSHYTFIKLFNHTSTFRRESDFPLTLQYLYSLNYLIKRQPVSLTEKNELQEPPTSLAAVLYAQSHCGVSSDRDRYVKEFMKHIKVDSVGSCLHNKDLPENLRNPEESFEREDFLKYIAKYKFHIAFENGICKDYMTEKLFRCLHVGSVPIYMGSSYAEDWMPNNKSIIMARNYKSPKELAEFIDFLDKNDDKYLEYLQFKETDGVKNEFLLKSLKERTWEVNEADSTNFITGFECHVCKMLNERLKAEQEHNVNKSVPLLPPKIANNTHFGCPQPTTSIGEPSEVPLDDRWHIMDWIGQYWGDLDKAYAVRDMLQAKETDSSKFKKYWDAFLRKHNDHHGN